MAAALPTIEIAFAPATEAFSANPRDLPLVKPTLEILDKADGQIKCVSFNVGPSSRASRLVTLVASDRGTASRMKTSRRRMSLSVSSPSLPRADEPRKLTTVAPFIHIGPRVRQAGSPWRTTTT